MENGIRFLKNSRRHFSVVAMKSLGKDIAKTKFLLQQKTIFHKCCYSLYDDDDDDNNALKTKRRDLGDMRAFKKPTCRHDCGKVFLSLFLTHFVH